LKNDSSAETFPLKHVIHHRQYNTIYLPTKFIKIEAISAWASHNYPSIWFVSLTGITNKLFIQRELTRFRTFVESENMKSILYHLRETNEMDLFETMLIKCRTKFTPIIPNWEFEHKILTELFNSLVIDGDFAQCEQLINRAKQEGLFNWYYSTQLKYTCSWRFIHFNEASNLPRMRGGHQMCLDSKNGDFIYLIGGWDGKQDLSDFWKYDIQKQTWFCISPNVEDDGGPSARSCHKVVFDGKRNRMYMLGRFAENPSTISSDFYYYDFTNSKWVLLSSDLTLENGPPILYDHQMVIDTNCENIFVMGGRALQHQQIGSSTNSSASSGFYAYHIESNKWRRILVSTSPSTPPTTEGDILQINSFINLMADRHAHSMCVIGDCIYIFGGVYQRDHIRELCIYNYKTGTVQQAGVFSSFTDDTNSSLNSINSAGSISTNITSSNNITNSAIFHQQMSACSSQNELFILSNGWMVDNHPSFEPMDNYISFNSNYNHRNDLWVYDITNDQWNYLCTLHNAVMEEGMKNRKTMPIPRFASQFVYSEKYDLHFLFGGNAGDSLPPNERLDDLWTLKCTKPSIDEAIVRVCKLLLRKQYFSELCQNVSSIEALEYLKTNITSLVNLDNDEEQLLLRELTSNVMFKQSVVDSTMKQKNNTVFQMRMHCFEELCKFWDPALKARGFHSTQFSNFPLSFL
jgi:hypothetical protein